MAILTNQGCQYPSSRENPGLLEPKDGEHVWVTVVAHVVSAESLRKGSGIILDGENIASVQTGCFVCEEPYSDRLSYRKCPGQPS